MIKNRLLAVLACAALGACHTTASMAKGLNYTYGEAGYSYLDADNVEGDGATARISFGATDHIHVKAEYTRYWISTNNNGFFGGNKRSLDTDRYILGVGGNYTVLEKAAGLEALDLVGTASFYDAENTGDSNTSDRGYVLEPGVRALVTKTLELDASLVHMHIDNFEELGFGAGAVYKFYRKYSAVANVRHFSQDDTTEAFIGIRLDF